MKAIYVRTSTDDNDGAAQLHQLRKWCQANGWDNAKEYIETDQCGEKDSRPEWDRLRRDAKAGKVDAIVATQLSRLGRSVVNVILALDELYRDGCRVVLLREALDYATPVGRAVAVILAAIAQLELDQIRERIRAGVARARECGTRSGRPIGRPRAALDVGAIENARKMRAELGLSWREIEQEIGVPAATIRRAVGPCQKGSQYLG